MANIDTVFGGNSLKADDLKDKPPAVVTISDVEETEFQNKETGKKEKKLKVSFRGTEKVLICNLINANMIADLADSRDYDNWTGTKIKLVVERVQFGAKIVDGIRVKDPSYEPPKSGKSVLAEVEAADDDIPF